MKLQTNFVSAFGKRKASVAKAILSKGAGKILINEQVVNCYFSGLIRERDKIKNCLSLVNLSDKLDINIFIQGGGISSQIDAACLAIAKAICKIDNSFRQLFNKDLLLRSDSRIKERRKYGLKKARKAPQYSKR